VERYCKRFLAQAARQRQGQKLNLTCEFDIQFVDFLVPDSISWQVLPTSATETGELTPTQPQTTDDQPQSKITRSKSVFASLGLKMSRKAAQPVLLSSPPMSPMRRPTVRIVENRENLMKEVGGIEDDESRRLTELAFMDF
jgi:hypothetical protein